MPKQIVQFVNKPTSSSKKKSTSPYTSGYITLNNDAFAPQKAKAPRAVQELPNEVMAVFDPPPEFAGREQDNDAALKKRLLKALKEKQAEQEVARQQEAMRYEPAPDLPIPIPQPPVPQPAQNPQRDSFAQLGGFGDPEPEEFKVYRTTTKSKKSKGKTCICGRPITSCSPVLYHCCHCGKQFCSGYVGRNRSGGMLIHSQGDGKECGPVIQIRKNSASQIKIKTS